LIVWELAEHVRTAVPELRIDALEEGVVSQVAAGGGAAAAGVHPGDMIQAVNGVPLSSYDLVPRRARVRAGEEASLRIRKDDGTLVVRVPFVRVTRVALPELVSTASVSLMLWGVGTVLLWRRFYRTEVRLLVALTLAVALGAALPPLGFLNWYPSYNPVYSLSVVAIGLSAPLLLHYHITYPVTLGESRIRRLALAGSYGAMSSLSFVYLLAATEVIENSVPIIRLAVACFGLELVVAVSVAVYVYLRRADGEDRRRLRLLTASVGLSAAASGVLYVVPAGTVGRCLVPEWAVRPLLLVPMAGYVFGTMRYGLFGLDRLLNRALVYGLLSLAVFTLVLGPMLLINRLAPDSPVGYAAIVATLGLVLGVAFSWARSRLQCVVDRVLYGGWYDYPAVVESISDALAGTVRRSHLIDVLTREVPDLMHLKDAEFSFVDPRDRPSLGAGEPIRRFPLRFRGETCAVWTVGPRNDGDPYSAADERILKTLARQAEIALRNVLLIEDLERRLDEIRASREQLARARRRLLRSREAERGRLARELHDGPIQGLVGLKLEIGLLLDSLDEEDDSDAGELRRLRGEVQSLLTDLRQVCVELRPPILDTLGLAAAIRALSEEWSAQTSIPVSCMLRSGAVLRYLEDHVTVNLYRIVQEGLSNVARHAAATEVAISLRAEQHVVFLEIRDDGCGFAVPDDFDRLMEDGHFGLAGIGERVDLIGGSWAISSKPGEGTALRVSWRKPPKTPAA
jgi:signal transduction histidine kinase